MLENGGSLVIAEADGDRVLAGMLLGIGGEVRQHGHLTLSGGLVQISKGSDEFGGMWQAGANILVDANGGRFELLSGSALSVSQDKHVTISADFVNRGRVFLAESSELRLTGEVAQNALGILTAGEWVLSGGSQLFLSGSPIEKIGAGASVFLGDESRFEGLALTANDGELQLDSNAVLELTGDFTNAGELNIGSQTSLAINGVFDNAGVFSSDDGFIDALQLDNRGTMTLKSGSLQVRNLTTNRGAMTLDGADVNGGFIFANAPGATLTLNDAVLNAATLSLQGTVRGTGVLNGEVHNFGTLAPGASPGTLEINGSLIAEPGSEMVIEFAGLEPGEFDLIEVHGDAVLDGTLKIYFLEGYLPRAGDSLDFLRVDGILQGAFADILFPELAPGFRFTTQFNAGQFRIVALTDFATVPTPAPAVLFSTCAVLLALSGRRGRHGRPASRTARGEFE
jgi:hypothetical protein